MRVIDTFYKSLGAGGLLVMEHTQKMPHKLQGAFTLVLTRRFTEKWGRSLVLVDYAGRYRLKKLIERILIFHP